MSSRRVPGDVYSCQSLRSTTSTSLYQLLEAGRLEEQCQIAKRPRGLWYKDNSGATCEQHGETPVA